MSTGPLDLSFPLALPPTMVDAFDRFPKFHFHFASNHFHHFLSLTEQSASTTKLVLLFVSALGALYTLAHLLAHVLAPARRHGKLPPGPRGLPFIGNVHQIPTEMAWKVFAEWGREYGGIFRLNAMGQNIMIVNSRSIAKELLDKRSLIYSDRPRLIFAAEMVGFIRTFALQNLGDSWRKSRRMVAHDFAPAQLSRYWALQENEARLLVRNLVERPGGLVEQVQWRIGSIIYRILYGYPVQEGHDPFLRLGLDTMEDFSRAVTVGNFLVDIVPALQYVPRWMPGAGFFKTAETMQKTYFDACYKPFEWCKANLATGKSAMPNLIGNAISASGEPTGEERDRLVFAASSVMGGGLDTNMSSALTFFRAMILNPHVQKRAQAELDAVVGRTRLPTLADRPNLPYLRGVVAEVLRTGPPAPLCLPHVSNQDDIFENTYYIPKGSLILPNIWAMLHDPEQYPSPHCFDPDRYAGSGGEAEMSSDGEAESKIARVRELVFGFGRRVCPGMHFAEGTLFAIVATTLATCEVLPGEGVGGGVGGGDVDVDGGGGYTSGTIVFPTPFTIRLKPRFEHASTLLSESACGTD